MFYHRCCWWAPVWALSLQEPQWKPACHSGCLVLGVDTRESWLHGWEGKIPCWRPQSRKVLNAGSLAISYISWVGWRGSCFLFLFCFFLSYLAEKSFDLKAKDQCQLQLRLPAMTPKEHSKQGKAITKDEQNFSALPPSLMQKGTGQLVCLKNRSKQRRRDLLERALCRFTGHWASESGFLQDPEKPPLD